MNNRRSVAVVLGIVLASAAGLPLRAQMVRGAEIGFHAGWTRLSRPEGAVTLFGLPGGAPLGGPELYASIFLPRGMVIEPQVGFVRSAAEGDADARISVAGQVAYAPLHGGGSPYVLMNLARVFAAGRSTPVAPGFGVGYRALLGALGARLEARYRRWAELESDEFSVVLGIGATIGRSTR